MYTTKPAVQVHQFLTLTLTRSIFQLFNLPKWPAQICRFPLLSCCDTNRADPGSDLLQSDRPLPALRNRCVQVGVENNDFDVCAVINDSETDVPGPRFRFWQ